MTSDEFGGILDGIGVCVRLVVSDASGHVSEAADTLLESFCPCLRKGPRFLGLSCLYPPRPGQLPGV